MYAPVVFYVFFPVAFWCQSCSTTSSHFISIY